MSPSISSANAFNYLQNLPTIRQTRPSSVDYVKNAKAGTGESVNISAAAKEALAAETSAAQEQRAIQQRLDAIKAKGPLERSAEETEFLQANDQKLAGITAKDSQTWTSSELDYVQKTGGFVNTMAELSSSEKAIYDELIAQGNSDAAAAMNMIGMTRMGMGGNQITLPNGQSFDPVATEITAKNIRNLFKFTVVDDSGRSDRQFEALAQALERRDAANKSAA